MICFQCTGGQMVQLVMEYLPLGSLHKHLRERKQGLPQCLLFAQQICQVSISFMSFMVWLNIL